MKVKRTERGWAGHFILADRCRFRRNTLLECGSVRLVVSSVGLLEDPLDRSKFREVGPGRYFETMVFVADPSDLRYRDALTDCEVSDFESPYATAELDADDIANQRHEDIVAELTTKLEAGEFQEVGK